MALSKLLQRKPQYGGEEPRKKIIRDIAEIHNMEFPLLLNPAEDLSGQIERLSPPIKRAAIYWRTTIDVNYRRDRSSRKRALGPDRRGVRESEFSRRGIS